MFALSKTTLPGLRAALDSAVPRPPHLTMADYLGLSMEARMGYDRARTDWVISGLRVKTEQAEQAAAYLTRTLSHNAVRPSGRRGLILTAPPLHGKSELALHLADMVEGIAQQWNPNYREDGEVPVVWLEAQSSTAQALMRSIPTFFAPDMVPAARTSSHDLREEAVNRLNAHRTRVVIIDEAHTLAARRGQGKGQEASSHIKLLQNQSAATFVLCGVDLMSSDAFGTELGRQVTRRCDVVDLSPHRVVDPEWRTLLLDFDSALPLCDHRPGMLDANHEVIHDMTGGCIADVATLVTHLMDVILQDADRTDERVTKERLAAAITRMGQYNGTGYILPTRRLKALTRTRNEVKVA